MDAEMNRKLSAVSPEEVETDTVKQEYGERMKKENGFENFKGNDPKIRHIRELGQRIARTDFPVLITGETGTGKEVIARAIHMESGRSEEPFVAINCGAIPAELLESELFGYEGGSFTGAKRQGKIGKFEMANKGTFFLDEIGDMPLYMQVKLLRVLQEHEIERVGGSGPIPIDVRILSATRMNLMEMVQAGTFREDLYYRLAVVNIQTVALRACPEDIILHASDYLDELNRQYKTHVDLSDGARRCLKAHSWPGNVRELQNAVESAMNAAASPILRRKDFFQLEQRLQARKRRQVTSSGDFRLRPARQAFEREFIRDALAAANGNRAKAAGLLGISRTVLYEKLEQYQLK